MTKNGQQAIGIPQMMPDTLKDYGLTPQQFEAMTAPPEADEPAPAPSPAPAPAAEPPPQYPESALSYLGNVLNEKARAFYARHGVALIEDAYERNREAGEVSLMIMKHCLR